MAVTEMDETRIKITNKWAKGAVYCGAIVMTVTSIFAFVSFAVAVILALVTVSTGRHRSAMHASEALVAWLAAWAFMVLLQSLMKSAVVYARGPVKLTVSNSESEHD